MKRRLASAALALLVAGIPLSAASGVDAAQPVFKVDSVTVSIAKDQPNKLIINAKGAVRTGGWEKPRLKVKEVSIPESDTMVVVFVAIPPAPKATVVQAILPVQATVIVTMPKSPVTKIKVAGETNSVSAKIVR